MKYPWYSEEVCTDMCNQFVKDHPEQDMDLLRKMASEGNIDEFRMLCNCLYVHQYTRSQFYDMSYEDSWELRNLCNERIHNMLGKYDELYNMFFKVWKVERWSGDETWRLFCDACKPHDEAKAILTLISMVQYIDKPLTLENLPQINSIYSHGRSWELFVEDTYSFEIEIPSQFKKANKRRKTHTHRWREFMNYVWEGDFTSGQQMITQYDKEYDEWIAQRRKKNAG